MAQILLIDLPAELLQHIAGYMPLAYHVKLMAPTCKVVSVVARNAFKVRPFDGEVVTLAGAADHTHLVFSLALLPDGLRFVSGSNADRAACIAYHGLAPVQAERGPRPE